MKKLSALQGGWRDLDLDPEGEDLWRYKKMAEIGTLRRNVPITQLRELNEPIQSLTPRSYEACMRLGIDPQTLQPSLLDDFLDKATDRAVAEKKLRHAVAKRSRNIELIERERDRHIREQERQLIKSQASTTGGDPASMGLGGHDSSTYLELERQRLEKVEALRQKEMQRLLEAERKAASMLSHNAAREALELRQREWRDAERKRRIDEAAKKAQAIELDKKLKAEREVEHQKEIAARLLAVERRRLEHEREEEEKRRVEAERLRADAAAAEAARREQLQQREQERLELQRHKLEQLRAAEEVVRQRVDEAKRARTEVLLERRRKAEERIAAALAQTAEKQEQAVVEFERKSREAEERAAAHEAALRKKVADDAREREANAAAKRAKKAQVLREEEGRMREMLHGARDGQQVMAENNAKRQREIALRKLEHELKMADKVEVCESLRRAQQYHTELVRALLAPVPCGQAAARRGAHRRSARPFFTLAPPHPNPPPPFTPAERRRSPKKLPETTRVLRGSGSSARRCCASARPTQRSSSRASTNCSSSSRGSRCATSSRARMRKHRTQVRCCALRPRCAAFCACALAKWGGGARMASPLRANACPCIGGAAVAADSGHHAVLPPRCSVPVPRWPRPRSTHAHFPPSTRPCRTGWWRCSAGRQPASCSTYDCVNH